MSAAERSTNQHRGIRQFLSQEPLPQRLRHILQHRVPSYQWSDVGVSTNHKQRVAEFRLPNSQVRVSGASVQTFFNAKKADHFAHHGSCTCLEQNLVKSVRRYLTPHLGNLLLQGNKSMEQGQDPKCRTSGLYIKKTL